MLSAHVTVLLILGCVLTCSEGVSHTLAHQHTNLTPRKSATAQITQVHERLEQPPLQDEVSLVKLPLRDNLGWSYCTLVTAFVAIGTSVAQEMRLRLAFDVNSDSTVFFRRKQLCQQQEKTICEQLDNKRLGINTRILFVQGLELDNFFVYLEDQSQLFKAYGIDGVIGLRYNDKQFQEGNLLHVLLTSNLVTQPVFSLYYGSLRTLSVSFVLLGDEDTQLFRYPQMVMTVPYQVSNCDQDTATADTNNQQQLRVTLNAKLVYFQNDRSTVSKILYAKPTNFLLDTTSPFISLRREKVQKVAEAITLFAGMHCKLSKIDLFAGLEVVYCEIQGEILIEGQIFPVLKLDFENITLAITPEDYIVECNYYEGNVTTRCRLFFAVAASDDQESLGYPFLRENYFLFDAKNSKLLFGPAQDRVPIPAISYFWYYTMIIIVFFWSVLMITCGIYYKEEMNRIMRLVIAIYKYLILRDAAARTELIMFSMQDDT